MPANYLVNAVDNRIALLLTRTRARYGRNLQGFAFAGA